MAQQCPHCNKVNPPSASYCAGCGLQLAQPNSQSLQTGTVLQNRYRIDSLLGQGGFGAVYRAWDGALKRPCAVKENLETGSGARDQFQQEASVLANLSHPNLPRVIDHFFVPGQGQYLVMDFVDGQDLDALIRQGGPITARDGIQLISQIADALNYLHSKPNPLIHRDIKPANIRVREDGQAFLVDFGLVKLLTTRRMTTAGARGITPGYSPPEQYGHGGTDHRTDIYALGATLYTLLTGLDPQESVDRTGRDSIVPVHLVNPAISSGVGSVIARSMALDPDRRYQSADAFKTALVNALSFPVPSGTVVIPPTPGPTPPGSTPKGPSFPAPKSKPILSGIAIGALIMAVIIVFIAVVGWSLFGGKSTPTPVAIEVFTPEEQESILETTAPLIVENAAETEEAAGEDKDPTLTNIPPITPTLPPPFTFTPTPQTSHPETNGEWIAYAYGDVRGEVDIYRMNMVTGQKQQLTSGQYMDESPTFSPDGRSLVYVSCRGECELYQLDLHSLSEKKLTNLPLTSKFPNYCNDPSKPWIVFEGRAGKSGIEKNIWMLNLDSGEVKQITHTNADSRPAWSPDCRSIVFGRATSDTNGNGEITTGDNLDIHILDVETLDVRRLAATSGRDEFNFSWSPNGEWIAFCSVSQDTNNDGIVTLNDRSDLFVIRPDGSGDRRLEINNNSVFSPSWSPDGRSIMFSAFASEGNQSIWSYSLDTGGLTQFTEEGPYYHPEWSP
jgi:serine/threonine protein kinase/Tol biopolymer transport system component